MLRDGDTEDEGEPFSPPVFLDGNARTASRLTVSRLREETAEPESPVRGEAPLPARDGDETIRPGAEPEELLAFPCFEGKLRI
jgi:hypothetical protein